MVEAALFVLDMTLEDWAGLYTPLCSRALKVPITDRSRLKTTYDETTVTEPAALAADIQACLQSFATVQGRCVVRASGTEPVVRVYAEAVTQNDADTLAERLVEVYRKYEL